MISELNLLHAVDGLADPLGVFSPIRDGSGDIVDFRVEYLNRAGVASYGRKDPIDGVTLKQLMAAQPGIQGDLFDQFLRVATTGKPLQTMIVVDRVGGERSRYIEVCASKFDDGLVAQWREIREGKNGQSDAAESAERLRAMNEILEQRVLERTAEANARTHQLRELALALADAEARERKRLAQLLHDHYQQLLSAAKLKTGILRRIATDQKVIEGASQVERLLEEALTAAHSLSADLAPAVLYDAGLNAGVQAMSRNIEQRRRLHMTVAMDDRAEPAAEQVRVLLFEAIRELLHNVMQHAHATTVSISSTLTAAGQIEIIVADDGQGFDPSSLSERRHSKGAQPFGLLEIRERLGFIGGEVEITSRVGAGTRVRLVVPVELRAIPEATPSSAGLPGRKRPVLPFLPPGKPARVIVADDHPIFREGLIALLAQEPMLHIVGTAADGEQTIQITRELRPDLLLLDITMPVLNGIEVAAALSREMPEVRIVGLSMHKQQDMAAAMLHAGAMAYFTKGGSSETLLNMLRELLWSPAAFQPAAAAH